MEHANLSFLEKLIASHALLRASFEDEEFNNLNAAIQDMLERLAIQLYAYLCAIQAENELTMETSDD